MAEKQERQMDQETEGNDVNASTEETSERTSSEDEQVADVGENVETLQAQVQSLQQDVENQYNRYLRTQADFDNFRKRTRKEKEDWLQYASMPLVEALLPAFDNLERAISASEDTQEMESLHKGIEIVYRQIKEVLEKEGLKVIEAQGQLFDPAFHQAVMQEENAEYEPGVVIAELQKGYIFKDKVLRPSMVKVSS
jgi:molecular chaperone GrpE